MGFAHDGQCFQPFLFFGSELLSCCPQWSCHPFWSNDNADHSHLIVIAHDGAHAVLHDMAYAFPRCATVADDITEAVDFIDLLALDVACDGIEGVNVAMDVGDEGNERHSVTRFLDDWNYCPPVTGTMIGAQGVGPFQVVILPLGP